MGRKNPYQADHRTRAARARGFPARSVFKLEEIDRRVGLFHPRQSVVDLGAAPGSWTLYAAGRVGANGRVLAIDLQQIQQPFASHVTVLQGDALDHAEATHGQHGPYDVVLSDMAPKTTGDRFQNAYRSYELLMAALAIGERFGKPGSAFVGKIFMGQDFETAKNAVRKAYAACKVIRPSGTRDNSVEVFLVGTGRRLPGELAEGTDTTQGIG